LTRGIPPTGPGLDPQIRKFLEDIKQRIEVGDGQRGNPLHRYLKIQDLLDLGIATLIGNSAQRIVSGGNLQPTVPAPDLAVPPAPTGFTVTGGFSHVFLQWDDPQSLYRNHSYTVVYRNTADNIANAAVIAQVATGMLYADLDVSYGVTYYYWIRFVSNANVEGPFNSSVGTAGKISEDPAELLARLQKKITEAELYDDLNARIDLVDEPGTGLVSQVTQVNSRLNNAGGSGITVEQKLVANSSAINGLYGSYTLKIDNNGVVSGFGLSSETVNGQVNSFFLVNADTFGIVNSGEAKNVTSITRSGTTATANCASHGYQVGQRIVISNVYDQGWNGVWEITGTTTNSFTFTVPNTLATPATSRIRLSGRPLASLTRSGTTATAALLSGPNEFAVGEIVDITGAVQTGWNGEWTVSGVSGNNVTFTVPNTLATPATSSIRAAVQTIPFVVDLGKVVMDGAFIKNASINTAQVGSIAVDVITGVTSSFILSTIGTGNITNAYIGDFIRSNNYVAMFDGWNIDKSGNAEFHNIYARGNIEATSLKAGVAFVGTIQSTNYSAGVSGWKLFENGNAEFNGVVISRPNVVVSGTLEIPAVANWQEGHFRAAAIGGLPPVTTSVLYSTYNASVTVDESFNETFTVIGPGGGYEGYWEFRINIPTSQFTPDEVTNVKGRMLVAQAIVVNSEYWYTGSTAPSYGYETPCTAMVTRVANYGASGSYIQIRIQVPVPFNKHPDVYSIRLRSINWSLSAFT
jgi:hypothetical protein